MAQIENSGRIAYIAPEIPGKSSTFVYNEIIELEKLGKTVLPFSLHSVETGGADEQIVRIARNCHYVYEKKLHHVLVENVKFLAKHPLTYLKSALCCLGDSLLCIKDPKLALGQIYRFLMAGYLSNKLLIESIDHIHCHFSHIATDIGMYTSMLLDTPFSFTAHANDIFQRAYLMRQKGERAKFVATISIFNMQVLKSQGIPADKMVLVRCGVDTNQFSPRDQSDDERGEVVLGFLGRLVEKKGVDILINAMAKLSQHQSNIKLEIMGDGPLEQSLKALVQNHGMTENVSFGGALAHDNVSSWYEKIDYFVFPGKVDSNGDMDGIPVVLMEAMMRGVPVIATSVSGIPELVVDGITGTLSEPDAGALAVSIQNIVNETPESSVTKINNAISKVESEFNLAKNTRILRDNFDINLQLEPCQIQ
ncbi:glycosyltransferase [Microbulbifer agarilyticus]|uniref:glycosyltransferase n=1 Tax=Microbulbifer agarilyticus TaxID=260552 RepID=UPI001CD7920F|nr:glycosyltransferase [Microbulbifer agarilyticus]MCA0893641.1 glycosyltransferase [Microbulbifer agarilyticus]